jgi:pimeloyl-ACP methyl ester carboxylesterase
VIVRDLGPSDAPTVLFLHGGNVAGWMWGPQLPAFADRHLLVPDLPGFGDNADLEWRSVGDTADAVAELVGERSQGAVDVVGLSLGASVGVELAVRHPALVRRLVLASPTAVPATRWQRLAARVQLAFWHQPAYWSATARAWGLPEEDRELFVRTGLGIRRETAERIVREVVTGISPALLERIAAPTLAIAGERDARTVARDSIELIRGRVPDAEVRLIAGAHHAVNLEAPEEFNAAVRDWIS